MKIGYAISRVFNKYLGFKQVSNTTLENPVSISRGARVLNSNIGKYTYIGKSTVVNAEVGRFCSIAAGVIIGGASHPTNFVSTSPVFLAGRNVLKKNFAQLEYSPYAQTIIGNDVWIGSNAIIKGGVSIGNGAVIGMGSIVTKDVPAYAIVGGSPARVLKMRFDNVLAQKIESTHWWAYETNFLIEVAHLMGEPEKFIEAIVQIQGTDKPSVSSNNS
ncbi:MAG: CatB-related O-acetyltransferase [Clostridia bacterium]|nr:CatB-related O-acetyltransferase [Clostridia bacterium]